MSIRTKFYTFLSEIKVIHIDKMLIDKHKFYVISEMRLSKLHLHHHHICKIRIYNKRSTVWFVAFGR